MEDARLAYISAPTNVCKNEFEAVEFYPDSGKPIHRYCDPKEELYIRVSNISDDVCALILDLEQEGEFQLYAYDEYTRPTCDKEDNALIFAFGDIGFPAISCEDITDCPDGFYGVCDSDGKVCLECSLTQMPNETQDKCLEVACDEETETLCDNGEAKWCCPNTELCTEEYQQCDQSDGMCAYEFVGEATTTKSYDCSYKFVGEATTTKSYDCAYELTTEIREDGTETVRPKPIEGKTCADSSHYCNLMYADETCSTNASKSTAIGETIYGVCSPMGEANTSCPVVTLRPDKIMDVSDACADPSHYCNLMYADEWCGTNASASTAIGETIYGVCSPMGEANTSCRLMTHRPDKEMQVIKPCPSMTYCYLKYADETCSANASASTAIGETIYGVCSPMDEVNSVCPVSKK